MRVACCKFVTLIRMFKLFLLPIQTEFTKVARIYDHYQDKSIYLLYSCVTACKGKAVPLHALEALGGRRGVAATHSRPRH
jgi:hypothetical protein